MYGILIGTMEASLTDYTITLFEVCESLVVSKRTISRYVRLGMLHPQWTKSLKGTMEYRFSKAELDAIKAMGKTNAMRHDATPMASLEVATITEISKPDATERQTEKTQTPGETPQDAIICLLKENNETLKGELTAKNAQIKSLLDQNHETNVLLLKQQGIMAELQAAQQPEPEQPVQWGSGNV